MDTASLMAISPLDGRYHDQLSALRPIFSEYGLMRFRLMVEVKWLLFLIKSGNIQELPPISVHTENVLHRLVDDFCEQDALRIKHIEQSTNHDVKAIEYFIKERVGAQNELQPLMEFIHFGCTSEDINNLAYALMIKSVLQQVLLPSIDDLINLLRKMAHDYAEISMLARTHGQPASPTTLGKEIANTVARLQRQRTSLVNVALLGKFNGASGNYNAWCVAYPDIDWQHMSECFVHQLGLSWNPYTTQIEPHDWLADFFSAIMRTNTILLDLSRDFWGYIALGYFKQQVLAHEVGSSAMPHKVNPIDFENAEGNLGLANALMTHFMLKLPISRFQRDLSDSTVLRNVGVAFAHGQLAYHSLMRGLNKLIPHHETIEQDLTSHFEVLSEAIQTIMRRFGHELPYETLKTLTRGQTIDADALRIFVSTLTLPEEVKKALLELHPSRYTGYAADLAKRI